jgi:hypothetical protein
MSELPGGGMYRPGGPDTSREAARSVTPHLTEIQGTVLAEFRRAGVNGMTDFDLETKLNSRRSTYRSRRAELVEAGLLKDSGMKRKQDGSNRTVWTIVA